MKRQEANPSYAAMLRRRRFGTMALRNSWTNRAPNWMGTVLILLFGLVATVSVYAKEIVIGQVAPLSGPAARQGVAYGAGMQLYFDSINKAGGIYGNTFRLARKDDANQPSETVTLTRKLLVEERPLALSGYFGSRNVAAIAASGVLEQERIALVGYRSTDIEVHSMQMFSIRAGLQDEISQIMRHLATVGITKLGLFYEENSDEGALLRATQEEASKVGVSLIARVSHSTKAVVRVSEVDTFVKAKPQAIVLIASAGSAAAFIEQYRLAGGTAQLYADSQADIELLSQRLGEEQMRGVVIAQVTPNPYRISSRFTREFTEAAGAKKPEIPVSYAMIEGYIAARIIVEAVRLQGRTPTREGFAQALTSMNDFDLGGYVVGFTPSLRSGSRFVDLSIVTPAGKVRQ
jgi:branched-chain amino acid transport system substrate-binding protein